MNLKLKTPLLILSILTISIISYAQFRPPMDFPNDHGAPMRPNPYVRNDQPVSACVLTQGNRSWNLHEPTNSYERAFEVLNLTPSGRQLLRDYNRQTQLAPHRYVVLDRHLRERFNIPVSIGAAYSYDGPDMPRTILYDPQDDLGLMVLVMAHELQHAIDPQVAIANDAEMALIEAGRTQEFRELQRRNALPIERRGYAMQDRVLAEMKRLVPCYRAFIAEHRRVNGVQIFDPTTPDTFIRNVVANR